MAEDNLSSEVYYFIHTTHLANQAAQARRFCAHTNTNTHAQTLVTRIAKRNGTEPNRTHVPRTKLCTIQTPKFTA